MTRRPRLVTFLVVGNIVLSLPAFGLAAALLVVLIPRALDQESPALVLVPTVAICLLLAAVGSAYIRGAVGFARGQQLGPNITRVAVNISMVPWALMVLRGAYDLIDEGTTRWMFFVPGVVMTVLLVGYRALLARVPTPESLPGRPFTGTPTQ